MAFERCGGGEVLGKCQRRSRGGAGIDVQGIATGGVDVQHHFGQIVASGKTGGGNPDAPYRRAAIALVSAQAAVGTVAQGVATQGFEIGLEGVGAAIGVEGAGIVFEAVSPAGEGRACGSRGGEGDQVGVGAGVGAAARHGAGAAGGRRSGDGGAAAEAIVGLDADDHGVGQVEGGGGVAACAAS